MLLQSLLLVVALALIGSALLTSTLVSAKSAFHEMVMRQSRSAMTDATASLISWAQDNVRENGIDQLPVWAQKTQPSDIHPACAAEANNSIRGDATTNCKLFSIISWNTTGHTDSTDDSLADVQSSEANNLATAQNEHRISATINVAITDSTGAVVYSRQSREITARVFQAYPYIVLTGQRDTSSEVLTISSSEGDTAGYAKQNDHLNAVSVSPNQARPASYTSTVILTTINCGNTINNLFANAQLDNNQVAFAQLRPYGNVSWAYEVPCKPMQRINPATAPSGYKPPSTNVYGSTGTINQHWSKNDDNLSPFAR